ncbi:hypothetical protein IID20_04350 [Patescibacteria group bacterium]|nr:hypothetical protein [Patescibacteria group bacterium]
MFNWEFVWLALFLGVVGSFNFNFQALSENPSRWFGKWIVRAVIYIVILNWIFWLIQPSIVSPYFNIFLILAGLWFLDIALGFGINGIFNKGKLISYGIFMFIFMAVGMTGCPIFRADDHHKLIGDVQEANWTETMAPVDEAHIRIVSKSQAQYLADKVLGESKDILGSRYNVGEVNICNVNGEIIWVAPLEFRGFWKWNKFETTPGYVLVSAEDNSRKPVLVDSLELEYLPSAFWGKNLNRHVYTNGYQGYQLRETSFELNDKYQPYFTISATKPTLGFGGAKTEGVIIVDPVTGDIEWYDVGQAPTWVDRVIPEEIAESYISKWGLYVEGWLNTVLEENNIVAPTPYDYGSDVWFVPSPDGQNYWFTGITSISSSDQSLVGAMMINTRNGQAYYYRLSGANEQAIYDAVTQALGADGQRWTPTQPIPYNIYGEWSFVVPIIGIDKPIFQRLAIVQAATLRMVIGKNKRSALSQYQRLLAESSGNTVAASYLSEMKTVTGSIARKGAEIQDGVTVYSILLNEVPDKLFTLTSQNNSEVLVARVGDQVTLIFLDTDEELVPVNQFDLHAIELKKSEIQIAYEVQVKASEKKLRQIEKKRQVKRTLDNMSDQELEELYELHQRQEKN